MIKKKKLRKLLLLFNCTVDLNLKETFDTIELKFDVFFLANLDILLENGLIDQIENNEKYILTEKGKMYLEVITRCTEISKIRKKLSS